MNLMSTSVVFVAVCNNSQYQLLPTNTKANEIHYSGKKRIWNEQFHIQEETNLQRVCNTRLVHKTGVYFSSFLFIIRLKYLKSMHDSNSSQLKRMIWT
jgi:hypothetical protein